MKNYLLTIFVLLNAFLHVGYGQDDRNQIVIISEYGEKSPSLANWSVSGGSIKVFGESANIHTSVFEKLLLQGDVTLQATGDKSIIEIESPIQLDSKASSLFTIISSSLIKVNASININGGNFHLKSIGTDKTQIVINEQINVSKENGVGGNIFFEADEIELLENTKLLATGSLGGGNILVGGDWQGGANEEKKVLQGSENMYQATRVFMHQKALIDASATQKGNGGTVVLWSDIKNPKSFTNVHGTIFAKGGFGGGDGGQIDTSGNKLMSQGVIGSASSYLGKSGTWLFDPSNITIGSSGSSADGTDDAINLTSSSINNLLNNGTNVIITTFNSGDSDLGDLTINSEINKSSGSNDVTLTLRAANIIKINDEIKHTGGSGRLNIIIDSDNDTSSSANGSSPSRDGGGIIILEDSISSGGGSIIFGGTSSGDYTGGNLYIGGGSTPILIASDGGVIDIKGQLIVSNTSSSGITINSSGGNISTGKTIDSGNSYRFVDDSEITASSSSEEWTNASADAVIKGGYLVSISSEIENQLAAASTINNGNYRGAWIGAWRDKDNIKGGGDYKWYYDNNSPEAGTAFFSQNSTRGATPNGSSINDSYHNFGGQEPNGQNTTGEWAGQFYGDQALWNDLRGSNDYKQDMSSVYNVMGYVMETTLSPTKLTLNAGTGNIHIGSAIGSNKAISNLTATASQTSGYPSISNSTISSIDNQNYNGGNAITVSPTVTLNGNSLTEGTDFTTSFTNNTEAGTASLTITGMGNYIGSKTVSFTIVKPNPIQSNLILEYNSKNYSSGNTLTDLSGNNRTGTISKTNGVTNNAEFLNSNHTLPFDGEFFTFSNDNNTITTPNISDEIISDSTESHSVELWIYPTGDGVIVQYNGLPEPNTGYHYSAIEISGGKLAFRIWNLGTTYFQKSISFGEWHHIVLSYNGSTNELRGYLDGSLVSESNITYEWDQPSNLYLNIGHDDATDIDNQQDGNSKGFSGKFGLLRVYNTALSANEVANNYGNDFKITPIVSFNNIEKILGSGAFSPTVSSTSTGTISYSISDPTVATASGNTITLVGTGSTSITLIQESTANYNSITVTRTLTVTELSAVIQAGGIWQPMIKQENFDPNDDQQAVSDTDLVGNATYAMLETQKATYNFSTAPSNDDVYYFRSRMGDAHTDGKLGTSFYLALDLDNDKIADVFVEANVKNKDPFVAFHKADPSIDGTGPSNTGWLNSTNNTNIERELTSRDAFIQAYDATTDLDSNGETDSWIEFGFTEESIKSFASDVFGFSITGDTTLALYTFTSTSQTANGDIGGINDQTADLTKTWEELGVVINGSLNNIATNAVLTPTINNETFSSNTVTVTGTWGGDKGGTDTLTIDLNGTSYTTSNGLTINNNSWSLGATLSYGTSYTVTATTTRASESKTATGTITVAADDSTLFSITLNNITLNPTFNSSAYSYSMSVSATTSSTTLTASATLGTTTLTINGVTTNSGSSTLYNIPYGTSTVTLIGTAPTGSTTTYYITITRSIIPTLSIVDGDATTDEDGDTAQIAAVLPQAPTADVTLNFTVGDTTEGSISPSSLTFTPSNWNTPQTITVTGIDDTEGANERDGAISYTITGTTVSADTAYNGSLLPAQTITNQNTDPPGISVTPSSSSLSESGSTISVGFALLSTLSPTTATVTMTVTIDDTSEASFSSSSIVTSTVVSLTQSVSSTSVTVYGVDDNLADGTVSFNLTTGDPSSDTDTGYNVLIASDVADVNLQTTDNDKVSDIYSDYGGYWTSGADNINATKPDDTHNLLGFSFGGKTYATGVSNTITRSNFDRALYLDGDDDYIEVNSLKNELSGDFTVETWFNLISPASTERSFIFSFNGINGTTQNEFLLGFYNDNNVSLFTEDDGELNSTYSVDYNSWYHLAAVKSGPNFKIYINGNEYLSETVAFTLDGDYQVSIGQDYDSANVTDEFNGYLDDFIVWNIARNQSQIERDMIIPPSGNESGLVAYYNFDQGIASGDNTSQTTLTDRSSNGYNGILNNFTLSGSSSNFVLGRKVSEQSFQALPFSNVSTSGTSYARLQGSSTSAPSSLVTKAALAQSLVTGTQGLDLSTGLVNLPQLKQTLGVGVVSSTIEDTTPDILVTQIDVPSASPDQLWFENSSGVQVGNKVDVDFSSEAKQGEWLSKSYAIPSNTAGTQTTSPLRVKALYLSQFGLTASDATNIAKIVYLPSGVSDPAFISYNTASLVPASTMSVTTDPGSYYNATTLSPTLVVQLRDKDDNNISQSDTPITVGVSSGTATLSGTLTVNTNSSGQATFTDLKVNGSEDIELSFTSPGLSTVTSTLTFQRITATISGFPDFTVTTIQEPFAVTEPTTNSDATIVYASTVTTVATIDSSTGSVTVVGAGTTTITATVPQNSYYTAATISATMTVNKVSPTIVDFADVTKTYGDADFDLTGTSSSTGAITYTVSDTNIATVSGTTISIVGAGSTSITLTQVSDNNYLAATATITLTVNKAAPSYTVTDVTKVYGASDFAIDSNVVSSSSTGSITYTSSVAAVATISGTTNISIAGAGTTVITATQSATSNYTTGTTSFTVTVTKADPLISTTISDVTKIFSNPSFAQTATSSSTGAFTFSSSDTDVIAVSTTTTATGSHSVSNTIVGTGTSVITISQEADANYNSATTSYTVTVTKSDPNLSSIADITKTYGDPDDTVTNTLSATTAIQYSSSDESVVQIASTSVGTGSQSATLTFTGAGTATVTAALAESDNYNAATVSFTVTVNKKTPTLSGFDDITKTYGDADFSLVQPTSLSDGDFTYSSSNTSSATISGGDTVSLLHSGVVTITATQAATGNYESATISLTLTINKASQSISVAPLPATKPLKDFTDPIPLVATSSSGNDVNITLAGGSAATLSGSVGNYSLTNVQATGLVTITFTVAETSRYQSATTSLVMNVVKTAQNITYSPVLTTTVTYSDNLTIPLTASSSSGLTVSYTLVSGPATLSSTTLTVSQTGVIVIDADQSGNAAYNPAIKVRESIVVRPGEVTLSNFSIPTKVDTDPDFTITPPTTTVSGGTTVYSSSDLSVATVSGTTLQIVSAGTTTITATQLAIPNKYNSASIAASFIVAVGDTDGDGVLDPFDLCPNTTAGSVVDANGCAAYQKDTDGDGVTDDNDNCVTTANADQKDTDGDGVGDICDNLPNTPNADQKDTDGDGDPDATDPDDDNDGTPDTSDAFPEDPNEDTDTDEDGIGNNEDPDDDNDGVLDTEDNCPLVANPDQKDTDGDGIGDVCDPDKDGSGFDDIYEELCDDLIDTDGDKIPDCADEDDDNDGYQDENDAFPLDKNEWIDTDKDGIGNNADPDDDGDGQSDVDEIDCGSDPLNANSVSTDIDQDGIPDCKDQDIDGDGTLNEEDVFPEDPQEWKDNDEDGTGDNADPDDDNDGYLDEDEIACQSDPLNRRDKPADRDRDTIPDCVDEDIDGDGCLNTIDVFPYDPFQCLDTDGDGLGDEYDWDDDGDGVADELDAFPLDATQSKDTDGDGIADSLDEDYNGDGLPDDELFPAQVFSPNGDGINEGWKIVNTDLFPNCEVWVYTRSGELVYNKREYRNDWQGLFNGIPLPESSYIYLVDKEGDGVVDLRGWVYLTR